jgi:hypothetical protein
LQGEPLFQTSLIERRTCSSVVLLKIELDRRFKKRLEGRFGKYDFQVGILNDAPHKDPKKGEPGLGGQEIINLYAGGPVRQKSRRSSGMSIAEVSRANRERLGFNYLSEPFKKRTSDIVKFSNEFFKLAFGKSEKRRAENLLQAIVRNPILRGDYGGNSPLTQKIKGFDRGMIDTAQLFKAIKSVCHIKGKR